MAEMSLTHHDGPSAQHPLAERRLARRLQTHQHRDHRHTRTIDPRALGTTCARPSAGQVQRTSPAGSAEAKQFVDAVNSSGGGQHLNGHAAGRQFRLQAGSGLHTAVRASPDDQPLRMVIEQRIEILKVQHVALTPPPVLLHSAGREQHVGVNRAPVHYQRPKAVPVDMHTLMIVPSPVVASCPGVSSSLGEQVKAKPRRDSTHICPEHSIVRGQKGVDS
jgi:hypothetical protein